MQFKVDHYQDHELTNAEQTAFINWLGSIWTGDLADLEAVSFQRDPENPTQLVMRARGTITKESGELVAGDQIRLII